MITEKRTTVFNAGCEAIVNTVNCKGVMGAGLALEFKMRYPEMFVQYADDCSNGSVVIGEIRRYTCDGTVILNFPTKDHWKAPSEMTYIEEGLDYMVDHYKEWGVGSIAIPPLGCMNGHLDQDRVIDLICNKLADLDIDVVICIDPGVPEGKEKQMVDDFRSSNMKFVCDYLVISGKQKEKLIRDQNKIRRFYQINSIDGIGEITYGKLFSLFYRNETDLVKCEERMSSIVMTLDAELMCKELGIKGKEKDSVVAGLKGISGICDIAYIEGMKNSTFRKIFDHILKYSSSLRQTTLF